MFGWLFRNRDTSKGLEERLETVERGLRNLSDDWEEFHDKVQRAVWRAQKRKEPVADQELPELSPEQPARNNLRAAPAPFAGDPISSEIRRRRGLRRVVDPASEGSN